MAAPTLVLRISSPWRGPGPQARTGRRPARAESADSRSCATARSGRCTSPVHAPASRNPRHCKAHGYEVPPLRRSRQWCATAGSASHTTLDGAPPANSPRPCTAARSPDASRHRRSLQGQQRCREAATADSACRTTRASSHPSRNPQPRTVAGECPSGVGVSDPRQVAAPPPCRAGATAGSACRTSPGSRRPSRTPRPRRPTAVLPWGAVRRARRAVDPRSSRVAATADSGRCTSPGSWRRSRSPQPRTVAGECPSGAACGEPESARRHPPDAPPAPSPRAPAQGRRSRRAGVVSRSGPGARPDDKTLLGRFTQVTRARPATWVSRPGHPGCSYPGCCRRPGMARVSRPGRRSHAPQRCGDGCRSG